MKYLKFLLLWGGLLSLGCEKETTTIANIYIDEDLAPYFERFQEEGSSRGVTVDFEIANISAYLEDIPEANVSGQCYYNTDEPNRLVIDMSFWRQASDIRKEFVIFHELGHCFLKRSHLETTLSDGTCASMMHSGLSGCRNAYNSVTRSGYLDELFLE
ncbi:hypothetical protein [Flavilitoribacter nigricans]|uniref:Uncharacterized protein n=1 Tax=Flavilitoribacter nigricans (strain ATCC 23147 / DSM 23189 / NBRC 102662 / NCIMB 1420 / SS-2) TaxID=1122177 RepID=A0A2D0NAQ8_FLAN2|nr:hypothetical protein [Flavilitoribacter nigricans]PHN05594.1 hypothetical protein CRP01_16530 [Flavilitoribacter nigricans DSM 23189 = NBRC 102662]